MGISWFLDELARRGVYRAAGGYAIASWVLVLMASQILPILLVPGWVVRALLATAIIGLPVACGIAWLLGERGVSEPDPVASTPRPTLNRLERGVLVALLVVTVAILLRGQPAPPGPPARSIAVLPFASLSSTPDDTWFADGLHEDLLLRLARQPDLKVISRNSVQAYRAGGHNLRDIARELGVATVLEGSVRRDAGRIRVSVQLIDAATDSHLWAETYDRELTSVFEIQSELAERIVRALRFELDGSTAVTAQAPPTADAEAYDLFLQARSYRSRAGRAQTDLDAALALYHAALDRDPEFAHAHAEVSRIHSLVYWFGRDVSPERLAQARASAERALALRPASSVAHLAMGFVHYYGARDYDRALTEFEAARAAAPGDAETLFAIGLIERRLGRWEQAVLNLEQASALDPRNADMLQELATTLQYQRRYADAGARFARVLMLAPDNLDAASEHTMFLVQWRGEGARFLELIADPRASAQHGLLSNAADWCWRIRESACFAAVLGVLRDEVIEAQRLVVPRAWLEAFASDDAAHRATKLNAAEAAMVARLVTAPDDPRLHAMLARVFAAQGRGRDAIAAAERASALVPSARDALLGTYYEIELAAALAAGGEEQRALGLVRDLLGRPSQLSARDVREDPRWRPVLALEGAAALVTDPPD